MLQLPHNPSNADRYRQKHLFRSMRLDPLGGRPVTVDTTAEQVHARQHLEDEHGGRKEAAAHWERSITMAAQQSAQIETRI